ncbi:MAG: hypothetical protein IPH59_01750 [bacterium]|nr:hypothetical protein [bacterium]
MNRQLKLFSLILSLTFVSIPTLDLRADTCDSVVCGDIDGDGSYNISDYVYITQFIFGGGPAPAPCRDIDGYDLITVRDLILSASMQPASCVTQPKIVAQPTNQMTIRYQRLFSQNQSTSTFPLEFTNSSSSNIRAFDLPLAVRVDGQIPQAISVSLAGSTWPDQNIAVKIDTAAGTILLSDLTGSVPPGTYTLCYITIEMPFSTSTRYTSFTYTDLGPYMTGVFEPPNSACRYPMFLDDNLNALQPMLRTFCLCGDVNSSGNFTITDAIWLIAMIFGGGPMPATPCLGDANGNGHMSNSDAVYLISYIWLGGPEPHCP